MAIHIVPAGRAAADPCRFEHGAGSVPAQLQKRTDPAVSVRKAGRSDREREAAAGESQKNARPYG